MVKVILSLVYLTLIIYGPLFGTGGTTSDKTSLLSLLPEEQKLQEWKADGSPEIVKGEDLYLLINGGAEVYHEYGFKQALSLSFKNRSGKYINLEIYQMNNAASAYGVYSFKTGTGGKSISLGQEALLEDYYLNFWKGEFVVTLIGFDASDTSLEGITQIARALDQKITSAGKKPHLIHRLKSKGIGAKKIKYIRGNLGLFNQYRFDTANIFGVKEGVIGTYPTFTQFIFQYTDERESEKWYQHGLGRLAKNRQFHAAEPAAPAPGFVDKNNTFFILSSNKEYIFITMSKDKEAALLIHKATVKSQQSRLDKEPK